MKWLRCMAAGIAALIALTGCVSGGSSTKAPLTLHVWHTYVEQMGDEFAVLVDEFNDTVGAEKGIYIDIAAVANATELNERLLDAAENVPGVPALPDLAVLYPKVAFLLAEKGMLSDFGVHFTDDELAQFVPQFLEEGKLGGDTLYLLPVAKSTEVLYVNRTLFERFAAETGVVEAQLATFEGIAAAAETYYAWTDAKTPEVPNDGKAFYYPDNPFNHAVIGFEQQGEDFLAGQTLQLDAEVYARIWNCYYPPAVRGGVAVFNNFGNYLAMTGDVVCVSSTSAGAMYYPDSVTYGDNTKENVVFDVLPYPVYENGTKVAMQRGGGICVLKTDAEREYAASVFLKWFTAPAQNLRFAVSAGYMPVTTEAFEQLMTEEAQYSENSKIQKALTTAVQMQHTYSFFIPPVFERYDTLSTAYSEEIYELAKRDRERFLALVSAGADTEDAWDEVSSDAFERLQDKLK